MLRRQEKLCWKKSEGHRWTVSSVHDISMEVDRRPVDLWLKSFTFRNWQLSGFVRLETCRNIIEIWTIWAQTMWHMTWTKYMISCIHLYIVLHSVTCQHQVHLYNTDMCRCKFSASRPWAKLQAKGKVHLRHLHRHLLQAMQTFH